MVRKICGYSGTLLMAIALWCGILYRDLLWLAIPALVLMVIGCLRMTDEEE